MGRASPGAAGSQPFWVPMLGVLTRLWDLLPFGPASLQSSLEPSGLLPIAPCAQERRLPCNPELPVSQRGLGTALAGNRGIKIMRTEPRVVLGVPVQAVSISVSPLKDPLWLHHKLSVRAGVPGTARRAQLPN